MTAWIVVLATTIASSAYAQPPRSRGDVVAVAPAADAMSGSGRLPSVQLRIGGDEASGDLDFLRGSLAVRLLDRGYCVTAEEADLSVSVESREDAWVVEVADGRGSPTVHTIAGSGAVAALEAIHRANAALERHRAPDMQGARCRAGAMPVRIEDDGDEASAALVRDWVGGLSNAGASLVRGSARTSDRICLRRNGEGLAVGRGETCVPVVRLHGGEEADRRREIERAVGAALAVATEPSDVEPEVGSQSEPEVQPEVRPEPEPEVGPSVRPEPGPSPRSVSSSESPIATLHAIAAGSLAVRSGGIDGAAVLVAGVHLRPGVLVAADVTVLPSWLRREVVAVDTDMTADLGYRLHLAQRSGLRFDVRGGARLHTWRTGGGSTALGRLTWLVGAGLAGWWRIGRDLTLELGLRQNVAGHGWLHEVGFDVAGERGRWTTMLVAGIGWIGRRR